MNQDELFAMDCEGYMERDSRIQLEHELAAKSAECERLREAYEFNVLDFAVETRRAAGFHALLTDVADNLCDRHGDMPKSKECRYCKLLERIRAALKDSGNG